MGMAAAGRAVAAAAVLLTLLAGGAYADCYGDCFKNCMAKQNRKPYCSYACDKVCNPDAPAPRRQRPPLAVVVGTAALADHHHHHPLDKKQDGDADAVWPAAALPDHPFHDAHGAVDVDVEPAGETDPGHFIGPVLP